MSVVNIRATISCDECGREFRVEMDPAYKGPADWTLWDKAEDTVRGGRIVPEKGQDILDVLGSSCSVQNDKMLCADCTREVDEAAGDEEPATPEAEMPRVQGDEPDPLDLVLLIEECGEVIQAATKALRFGWTHSWPDYEGGKPNRDVVTKEIGQLFACVERLGLSDRDVWEARQQKHEKLKRFGPEVFGRGMLKEPTP